MSGCTITANSPRRRSVPSMTSRDTPTRLVRRLALRDESHLSVVIDLRHARHLLG